MSESKRFLTSSSHYLANQVISLVVSLVSFPIIVRLLSVKEYGVLSLCNTILLLGVALSKMGLQNSIIRFYPEYERRGELGLFFRSFLIAGIALGIVFFGVTAVLSFFVLPLDFRYLFWLIATIVLFQTLFSYLSNFLRSQEKSFQFSFITILSRVLVAGGGILLLLLFKQGLSNLLQAQVLGYFSVMLLLLFMLRYDFCGSDNYFSQPLLRESMKFGLPLVAFELSSVALAFSDRFLINYFNGAEQLGIYAVGYTLCMYVGDLIRQPLSMAVGPMYTRIYNDDGERAAAAFLSDLLGYVALVALPVCAGCVAIGEDLVSLVASTKYLMAVPVIPWVLGGFLLYATQPVVAAGLLLKKKTASIAIISIFCGVLNIVANFILLKRFGIIAAAWTTLGSYVLAITFMGIASQKQLRVLWPYGRIFLYAFCSFFMYFTLGLFSFHLNLVFKIFIGVATYTVLIIVFDKKIRYYLINRYDKFRS